MTTPLIDASNIAEMDSVDVLPFLRMSAGEADGAVTTEASWRKLSWGGSTPLPPGSGMGGSADISSSVEVFEV